MNENGLPDLLSIQAQAVVDRAKSLGLTWTLRPATVLSGDDSTVVYDGDTEAIGAVNLGQDIAPTNRVMMLQVPPGGNYILGNIGGTVGSSGRGLLTQVAVTSPTSFVGTTQTIALSTAAVTFSAGRAYSIDAEGGADGTTANQFIDLRLYKGTTTGTIISEYFRFPWITINTVININSSRIVLIGAADVTTEVSFGISATSGTTRLFATSNSPFILRVTDVGPAALYVGSVAMP